MMPRVIGRARICSLWLIASAMACKEIPHNPSGPLEGEVDTLLVLQAERDTVAVGARQAVLITARVTRDASGQMCSFAAGSGSFAAAELKPSQSAAIDGNGQAFVAWYPPDQPGPADLSAQVGEVTGRTVITVSAVPDIVLANLPDTVAAGQAVPVTLEVGDAWAGAGVEVRVSTGTLAALGPVQNEQDQGTRVVPLLDGTGRATVLLTAPGSPGQVIVTASLFGTTRSRTVNVS
ncbi:MAG: hypothetical protein ACJ8DC_15130 [Gemmatimonadales bacterium]